MFYVYINDIALASEKLKCLQKSNIGPILGHLKKLIIMPVIIFMFYNIYFLHASFICIYFANIFAP